MSYGENNISFIQSLVPLLTSVLSYTDNHFIKLFFIVKLCPEHFTFVSLSALYINTSIKLAYLQIFLTIKST